MLIRVFILSIFLYGSNKVVPAAVIVRVTQSKTRAFTAEEYLPQGCFFFFRFRPILFGRGGRTLVRIGSLVCRDRF